MRSVRRAICTSGEPVSPFLVAYSLTTCCLRSALSDIGYLSNCWGGFERRRPGCRPAGSRGCPVQRAKPPVEVAALYTNSRALRGNSAGHRATSSRSNTLISRYDPAVHHFEQRRAHLTSQVTSAQRTRAGLTKIIAVRAYTFQTYKIQNLHDRRKTVEDARDFRASSNSCLS